jgi:subtilisin family serine protease
VPAIGTTVAVLDSGISRHPWLDGRYDPGCLPNEAELWDLSAAELPRHVGHGTFVAGIVRQYSPGSTIVPRRVIHLDGDSDDATLAAAIRGLGEVDVLNLSLGAAPHASKHQYAGVEQTEEAVWELQERHGTVVVVAAGNSDEEFPQDRIAAEDPLTVVVGALGEDDQPAWFSDDDGVTIWAPGVDVVSSFLYWTGPVAEHVDGHDPADAAAEHGSSDRHAGPHGHGNSNGADDAVLHFAGWAQWSGTSFAAPAVAGAIAAEIGNLADIREPRKRRRQGLDRVLASARQVKLRSDGEILALPVAPAR